MYLYETWVARVKNGLTVVCASGTKLKEASDQQQFIRNIDDFDIWLAEVEGQLLSDDYGKVRHTDAVTLCAVFGHCSRLHALCFEDDCNAVLASLRTYIDVNRRI